MTVTFGARKPEPPPRRNWRLRFAILIFFLPCCLLSLNGAPPSKLYLHALFGWIAFPLRVFPQVTVNPAAVGTFAGTLLLVTVGVQLLASWLRRSNRPEGPSWPVKATLSLVALFVLAFVAGIAAVGVFHQTAWLATQPEPFLEAQGGASRHGNEAAAIGALKSVHGAETIFREGDKDEDGVLDYGTLEELTRAKLVDEILGRGFKQGYVFEVAPSVATSEYYWFATAVPESDKKGTRYFFTNQAGVIFYTTSGPFRVDRLTCEVPKGLIPTGK